MAVAPAAYAGDAVTPLGQAELAGEQLTITESLNNDVVTCGGDAIAVRLRHRGRVWSGVRHSSV